MFTAIPVVLVLAAGAEIAKDKLVAVDDLVLARASDSTICELLAETLTFAAGQIGEHGADAALVYTQQAYVTAPSSYRFVANDVWWVQGRAVCGPHDLPAGIPIALTEVRRRRRGKSWATMQIPAGIRDRMGELLL